MATKKEVPPAPKDHKIGRDAGSGKFIPVEQAKKRPGTTVVETTKRSGDANKNRTGGTGPRKK